MTDLIRLLGTSPSGIGFTIERAEVTAKDNKYQLIDSFTEILKYLFRCKASSKDLPKALRRGEEQHKKG
ncbi:MAG: hypothetical protein V3V48_15485, partial [Candidatus Aminicenantaceae bacterium]